MPSETNDESDRNHGDRVLDAFDAIGTDRFADLLLGSQRRTAPRESGGDDGGRQDGDVESPDARRDAGAESPDAGRDAGAESPDAGRDAGAESPDAGTGP